ncbi:glycosyltransferase [Rubrobacter indicoceani]|uniref:glycosyltransferase n=1 Tax=Rubrobacter indicoceani TaxID=2051957 RepID=UPI000E5B21D3|nr:glycosyltransferase [Rubrobacter indicoceani]
MTVGDTSRATGGHFYNEAVACGLRKRGHRVNVVVASGDSFEEQRRAAPGFGLDPEGFDVIVVDMLARAVCEPQLSRWRSRVPVVALVHELPGVAAPQNAERERPGEDALLASAGPVVAVSRDGADRLVRRSVERNRVRVVRPGFDRLASAGPATEVDHAPGTEGLTVLCVAQWIPRKDVLGLVEAWREIGVGEPGAGGEKGSPAARLRLVGETDAEAGYARLVRVAVSKDPSIEVAGRLPDKELKAAYAGADLFALPSRYEGYGIVYAEALSFGLPVLARSIGVLPEMVGEAGVLVPEDAGPQELARALESLVAAPERLKQMSDAARKRAAELPRWRDTVSGFEEVLREAVNDKIPEPSPERNRRSWNAVVAAHESHRTGLAEYLGRGGTTLFPEERELLGEVGGKRLVHLQCNTGSDTLSLAALGAEVTGVDISDAAIDRARELSDLTGIPARFERADLYSWLRDAALRKRRFDLAFSTYGVVCWLDDLRLWARGVRDVLEPGGAFVLVDFHPASMVFDAGWDLAKEPHSGGRRVEVSEGVGDYVGAAGGGLSASGFEVGVDDFRNPEGCTLYLWGLGEVVSALAGAGLQVERLEEYPYANGERHFDAMREGEGRRMYPPEAGPKVPLMYGLRARRVRGQ